MKDVYLISYSVKGIKNLDQTAVLSFYKKTISQDLDTQQYNIKGIYGMNGSGKSGIVTSVDILKNLLINPGYLNNPIVQKNLDAIINKKNRELVIVAEFLAKLEGYLMFFQYKIVLSKSISGNYVISCEQLLAKKITSKKDFSEIILKIENGEIIAVNEEGDEGFVPFIKKKTINLLSNATICALFYEKILMSSYHSIIQKGTSLFFGLSALLYLGINLYVYLEHPDEHSDYFIQNLFRYSPDLETVNSEPNSGVIALMKNFLEICNNDLDVISVAESTVPKSLYGYYEKTIKRLKDFLQIFKPDLLDIEIDKKEDHDDYVCSLIMVYDSYKVNIEFESTGIKKLVKLYAYLKEMAHGGIVFIDEFDSNLHDVYLCALLEYLMEYGKGQLCFTTHNVGPMDILKQHKKSIDFLSTDHKIYSWTTNGNYSPSRLYRNGMIEGSPFNVDSIDFIGVFDIDEEDE